MAYNTYNEQELRHLEKLAQNGDETALDMILTEAKRLAKAANSRLLRLEKNNFQLQSQAYQVARFGLEKILGKEIRRYRINTKLPLEAITDQFREMRSFMSKESSTVRGIKYSQKRMLETLEGYGIKVKASQRQQFFEFIQSDTFQDVVDYVGEYDLLMDLINNNLDKMKNSLDDLYRQFEAFLSGNEYYDEFITRLSEGTDKGEEYYYKRHQKRNIDASKRFERYR